MKSLLIISSLVLTSPVALAQTAPATPADPAIPATPAVPAEPAKDAPRDRTVKAPEGKAGGGMSGTVGDFAAFDANGDGKLSKDEASADASLNFKELDRDKDGNVSRGEYESGVRAAPPGEGKRPQPKAR